MSGRQSRNSQKARDEAVAKGAIPKQLASHNEAGEKEDPKNAKRPMAIHTPPEETPEAREAKFADAARDRRLEEVQERQRQLQEEINKLPTDSKGLSQQEIKLVNATFKALRAEQKKLDAELLGNPWPAPPTEQQARTPSPAQSSHSEEQNS